ncbi:twin-arginine translocation signal domain-containing protein [Catellatospora coxensis]
MREPARGAATRPGMTTRRDVLTLLGVGAAAALTGCRAQTPAVPTAAPDLVLVRAEGG